MKTYLSTDYSTYDEFAEALKPDLAENISFPIKAVHKTFGECFIESIRPMVQDYGVDFVVSVKLPTGETKLYSYNIGFIDYLDRVTKKIIKVPTHIFIILGLILVISGFGISIYSLLRWSSVAFGELDPSEFMFLVIPANIFLILGAEMLFSSILINIMNIKHR
jgi:hypothetical protein